jgi:hypothetical protein
MPLPVGREDADALWSLWQGHRSWLLGAGLRRVGRFMFCNDWRMDDRCDSGPCLVQPMDIQGVPDDDARWL